MNSHHISLNACTVNELYFREDILIVILESKVILVCDYIKTLYAGFAFEQKVYKVNVSSSTILAYSFISDIFKKNKLIFVKAN